MAVPTVLVMTFTMFHAHTHADGPCDCGDFRWCRAPDGTARAPRATGSHCVVAAETSLFMSDMFFCLFSFLCLKCGRGEGAYPSSSSHRSIHICFYSLPHIFQYPPLPSFVKRRAETARIFFAALSGGSNWHRKENAHTMRTSPKQQEQQRAPAFCPQTEPAFMRLNKLPITR